MEKRQISFKKQVLPVLVTVLLVCTVVMCFTVVVQVLTQGYASLFGHSLFRVVTGSMEPEIPVGTLIVSRDTDIDRLEIGDVICFQSLSPSMRGRIITHRVIGKTVDETGAVSLQTKGDANPSADGYPVTQENLVGRVIWRSNESNFLTDLVAFFSNEVSFLACIALPCLVIAGLIFRNSVGNIKQDLENAMESLLELEQNGNNSKGKSNAQQSSATSSGERSAPPPPQMVGNRQIPPGISKEEYEEMQARIRAELIEEIKQEMMARVRAEVLEELKQENDREKSKKQ